MTISKKKKKKEGRLVRKITKSQLADPTYKKVQPRKKGKTLTPTELKEFKKLAKAHDEEAGYDLASISAELPSKPVMKKKVDPQELKTRLEKQRKKAEVEEFVVKGDPKLKQIGVIKRQQIKPLTEQEMARIRSASVRQSAEHLEAAELYQDQLKAQKFLAGLHRGRIKPFPKNGYPIFKIQHAYRKRKPKWGLVIRRNRREGYVYMTLTGPRDKLAGRDAVHREVSRVLVLMNMRIHPSGVIEDIRPPFIQGKYARVRIKVRADKIGEGEIRPRLP